MSDTNDSGETQFGRGEVSGQPRIIPKSAKEALRPEQVPEPPSRRRSRKARSQIVIFLNFVMTVVVFATIIGITFVFHIGRSGSFSGSTLGGLALHAADFRQFLGALAILLGQCLLFGEVARARFFQLA